MVAGKVKPVPMRSIAAAIFLFLAASPTFARVVSVTAGIGSWYSDDLRSSYQYGAGILVRPIEWFEFSASYDRAPASVKSGMRWETELRNKTLQFWRLGVTFPSEIQAMGLTAYLFPLLAYVITDHADKIDHGFGIGGGLEFLIWKKLLGARFEALEQFYRIPTATQKTSLQDDFFFALRLSVSY
jgi:hypothetical protein